MKKAPWFIMNHLMSVQYWIPEVSPHEVYFDANPFWIQVHNLPLEYMDSSNVNTILRKVGKVMEIEESIVEGKILRTLMRARVEISPNHNPQVAGYLGRIYQRSGPSTNTRCYKIFVSTVAYWVMSKKHAKPLESCQPIVLLSQNMTIL